MEYSITPMTREDVPEVTVMNNLCFTCPWSEQSLMAETTKNDAVFLVARSGAGVICGYAGLNYVLDEGYIANIAVHPEYRRQGIARLLLEALIAQSRRLALSFITLEVRVSNTPAQKLYEAMGFEVAGRRKNFYEAIREDAIIMTKYLTKE
ncbi:MAG: ribosomal protein S18-alanine N-acetyltransferase [Angelakisella sp.]